MKSQNLTQGGILKSLVTFAFPVLLALFLALMLLFQGGIGINFMEGVLMQEIFYV